MATLAFSAIGSTVGGSFLPAIGTISGAALGKAAGAIAGRYVDQALFNTSGQARISEGPRLEELNITTSTEGRPIPRIYGAVRVPGQIIWATSFEEEILTHSSSSGQSGGGKGSSTRTNQSTSIDYRYYANFAIALAEGEITRLGRVWANGNDLNLADYNYRFYNGSESQTPDSLIEARLGAGNAPAYRGICYLVFEKMPLAEFGNRIPQLNMEIFRSLDDFENTIKAVTLIPSAGEYVYENEELTKNLGNGVSEPVNTHTHQGKSDWDVSLDQLQTDLKNAENISLFVSWFGTDLRAGQCQIRPAVDNREKEIYNRSWLVSNEERSSAHLISLDEGRPAYGGTPSDETVISAIRDLNDRGLKVTFNPFILMDIPADNTNEDPYTDNLFQPKYPWRGRITVNPAPGRSGTPDKTRSAAAELTAFIGSADVSDFTQSTNTVLYHGPAEWGLRRMVLHYAHLCAVAGGVDSFLIGSELINLTTIRDENNEYPFVTALSELASDIKSILGESCKVTYAADWSEYFGHQPADGSGDVYFHLDPLWASVDIDAVGIDCYWPLSDWRSGNDHLDANQYRSVYDLEYLKDNITGAEGFDWYYASEEDRQNQIRTPITDGAGKSWVFRYKDIKSWWSNQHYNRPEGIEEASATDWVPEQKPIWLLEVGCPALNFGSNQPNVFVDPKSSESAVPYHSDSSRDDYIQRRYITAINHHFSPDSDGFSETNNPQSAVYEGRMVPPDRIYVYTWDARPFPAFPANTEIWGDGENWLKGHWLTGRTGSISLNALLNEIMNDYGFSQYQHPDLEGVINGYVIDRIMPARDALQPLELAFFFDTFEGGGEIKFRQRKYSHTNISLKPEDLVETSKDKSLFELKRAQQSELPRSAKISFIDGKGAYEKRTLEGQQTIGNTRRVAVADLPMVLDFDHVQSLANKWVQESWAAREEGSFALPPSMLAIEPADTIQLELATTNKNLRITGINDQHLRGIEARSIELELYQDNLSDATLPNNSLPQIYGPSKAEFFDLPLIDGDETPHQGYLGAVQSPWPGRVAFYTSAEETNYTLNQTINAPAQLGTTLNDLTIGARARWDYKTKLQVTLDYGELSSAEKIPVLGGENMAAIRHDNNLWEIIQFQNAELIAPGNYELSGLLRAVAGTEEAMMAPATTGAAFVIINEALTRANMNIDQVGLPLNCRYGPAQFTIGHPSYHTRNHTFSARGLRPLSPVHIKASNVSGDFHISWIRRSRIGGDSWELTEIPIGEASELYEIDIVDEGEAIRTIRSDSQQAVYSAPDQITDWGSIQSEYTLRIYQLSEIYGRGTATETTLQNV